MCCIVYPCSLFVIAKMCQKKSKVLFYPHSKEKRKNLEKLSTTSRFFLLFNINVCIFIQIHLMLLLIYTNCCTFKFLDRIQIHLMLLLIKFHHVIFGTKKDSNTSYVIINHVAVSEPTISRINSNTSYVIINHIFFYWKHRSICYSNTSYVIINPFKN